MTTVSTNDLNDNNLSYFTVTQRLIDSLIILNGTRINLEQTRRISMGIIDLISGVIYGQSFNGNSNKSEQVIIKSEDGKVYTLSNNPDLSFPSNVFDLLKNASLINRPSEIYIKNLNDYCEVFKDAQKFGHTVICMYDRKKGEIEVLQSRPMYSKCHGECVRTCVDGLCTCDEGEGICKTPGNN